MGLRQAFTVIGAVVGAWFGNPQLGFAIGAMVGGFVDPEVIDGPRVGDVATQTSAEGVPCPLFAGTAGAAGNLIFKGPVDKTYTNEGGKGSPPEQRTEHLHCTFAIRVGASLFTRPGNRTSKLYLIKIWEMEKLVYDVSPESTILEESEKYARDNHLTWYHGDEEQLPDPMLEAIKGAGNVPSYRGRAYVVMRKDVTDYRGAVPEFRFEVTVGGGELESGVSLVTNGKHYGGVRSDMEPAATAMGWHTNIDRVRVSPNGLYAFGWSLLHPTHPPEWRVYDEDTDTWSAIASPAELPVGDILCAKWSPDNEHLGVGTATNAAPDNFVLYRTVAGVTAKVADSPEPLPNHIIIAIDWDGDGTRLLLGKGSSAEQGALYDFIGGMLVNLRKFGESGLGVARSVAFQRTTGSRYAAMSQSTGGISVWRITEDPVEKAVSNVGANAGRDVFWDRTLGYLYTVGLTGPNYLNVWEFQGSTTDAETLTYLNAAVDQPSAAPYDSSVSSDGEYLAVTVSTLTHPLIYRESESLPPTLDKLPDLDSASAFVKSADWTVIDVGIVAAGTSTLEDVVLAVGARFKMPAAMFDAAHLDEDIVRGLVVASQNYTGQDLLNALRWVYRVDGTDHDGQIHFPKRGGASTFTLTDDDFVDEQDDGEQEETLRNGDDKRQAPIRRAVKLNLMFPNRTVGYQLTKATSPFYPDREEAVSETTLEVPVVLRDTDEAPQLADILEKTARADAEAEIVRIVHEGVGAKLTAGDVGTMTERGLTRRVRVESYREGSGTKRLLMRVDRPHANTSQIQQQAIPAPPAPPASIPGDTQFVVINGPGRIDSDDRLGIIIGARGLPGSAWYATLVRLSTDGGTTYSNLTTITQRARIGQLLASVPAASEFYTDTTNVVQVQMMDEDDIESITTTELLNEANPFAIAYDDGTAEFMQFRDAVDDGDGAWSLSHLLRGRLATVAGAHSPADKLILLEGTVFVPLPSALIGQTLTLQFVSAGEDIEGSPTYTFVWDPVVSQTEFDAADLVLARATNTISAEVIPRHRFGSEMNPIASVNFDGYRWTASAGANSSTVDTGRTDPTASFDVTGWSSPVTVTVALLNRYTGAGPTYSEAIA